MPGDLVHLAVHEVRQLLEIPALVAPSDVVRGTEDSNLGMARSRGAQVPGPIAFPGSKFRRARGLARLTIAQVKNCPGLGVEGLESSCPCPLPRSVTHFSSNFSSGWMRRPATGSPWRGSGCWGAFRGCPPSR